MAEISVDWFNEQARRLVIKHWGLERIPRIVIDLDQDLDWENCVAYYCNDIRTIAFNSGINKKKTQQELKKILLHELCHWYLHITEQPHRDSDERFARELIRVGIPKFHNFDEKSRKAATVARKSKREEAFEIYEENDGEILTTRLKHSRKNKDDFIVDLRESLIKMHNERVSSVDCDDFYPVGVAEKMCEDYGYRIEPLAVYGITLSKGSNGWGIVGDRDDVFRLLLDVGMDYNEIEDRLFSENILVEV